MPSYARIAIVDTRTPAASLHLHTPRGDNINAWIKSNFDVTWEPKRACWRVDGIHEPTELEATLALGSFHVLDADLETQVPVSMFNTALMRASEREDMVRVFPRLVGRSAMALVVPDVASWIEAEGCWYVPRHLAARVAADQRVTVASDVGSLDIARPAPSIAATTLPPLVCDGTIFGLKGIDLGSIAALDSLKREGLEAMGITSVFDILHTAPRAYIDRHNPTPITASDPGTTVTIIGKVTGVRLPPPDTKRPIMVDVIDVGDGVTQVSAKFFHAKWIPRMVRAGMHVLLTGKSDTWNGRWQMVSPLLDVVSEDDAIDAEAAVIGTYPASASKNISTWDVRRFAKTAALRLPEIYDPVPETFTAKRSMMTRTEALRALHVPQTPEEAQAARWRMAYEELFRWQVTLAMQRTAERSHPGVVMNAPGALREAILASKPYPLTGAQTRVIDQIVTDMASPVPMNRLVQGDVGFGKTEVAIHAIAQAVESGKQAVLMAPLDDLAGQHFREVSADLAGRARVEFLGGGVVGKKRKEIEAAIAAGEVDVIIGTSAVLGAKVRYNNLGLVIIDEQHRFGVEQRATLMAKGRESGFTPDLLVMTATPAPRTAQLTVFGDLDVSVIDEAPPGRSAISTGFSASLPWQSISDHVASGHQVFIVTPSVTTSKTKGTPGVEDLAATVQGSLPGVRVGFAHGKQKLAERNVVMDAFRAGEIDVLVSTTIIEVGVNVPNATLLVLLGAENFGITQMHQLRGRVGRGQWAGECTLSTAKPWEKLAETTQARIEAVLGSTNGFELAELDLSLRGPGSLTGIKQEGQAKDLRVADPIKDIDIVEAAREDARELVAADPTLAAFPALRAEIEGFIGKEGMAWLATL